MKDLLKKITLFFVLCIVNGFYAQKFNKNEEKMQWFADAKLGIFIHWGIYSVNGIPESWSFFNNYISHENYLKQLKGFTAKNYEPKKWVDLIKNSGAKYAVMTSKHHDGIALWDTNAENSLSIPKNSVAQKDVLSPFINALQQSGLKTGIYFSLPDWSSSLYDIETRTVKRYNFKENPKKWNDFVDYYQYQLKELSEKYNPDLVWFDGNWEHTSEEWKSVETLQLLRSKNPNIIINSRLDNKGDYATPEQGIPVLPPQDNFWELCYTMNDSWGFQPFDTNYKTPNMIIRTLVDCISMGGNLLLDIGPKEDGTIPKEHIEILEHLGIWTKKHSEAIYGTVKGLPYENYDGKSALSKDRKTLFLYLEEHKNKVFLSGIVSQPKSISVIGDSSAKVNFLKQNTDLQIQLQSVKFDDNATVLKVVFNEPISVEKPKEIQSQLEEIYAEHDIKKAIHQIVSKLEIGNPHVQFSNLDLSKCDSEFKDWIVYNQEIFQNTEKGISKGHFAGKTVLSKDKQTLYLFVEGKPTGPIALKGLKNTISRVRIVGEGTLLLPEIYNKLYWSSVPGIVYINIPKEKINKNGTVIAVLLDKPIDLYTEEVKAIESN